MSKKIALRKVVADPAAVLGCALSLYKAGHERAERLEYSLSDLYNGGDQFMREVMRVATAFEDWACEHIQFDKLYDVWPYTLEDKFGPAVLTVLGGNKGGGYIGEFVDCHCLLTAVELGLPIKAYGVVRVPLTLRADNPAGGEFTAYEISRLCCDGDEENIVSFNEGHLYSDPNNLSGHCFGVYGINGKGQAEHIADRADYAGALELVRKMAPGIVMPDEPVFQPAEKKGGAQ